MIHQAPIAIIQFPGSNCEQDCIDALALLNISTQQIWHTETTIPRHIKGLILPGGFSYGDYLRGGALAALSPISSAIRKFAEQGKPILGICNGFQILTELGLLPGTLLKNNQQTFTCQVSELQTNRSTTKLNQFFQNQESIRLPIAHGEGKYHCSKSELNSIIKNNQDILRYSNNPNGSIEDIAGITNAQGNIMGMMPHPERAMGAMQTSQDGKIILEGYVQSCL